MPVCLAGPGASEPVRLNLWRIAANRALNCVWTRRSEPAGDAQPTHACARSNQSGAVAGDEWKQGVSLTSVSVQSAQCHQNTWVSHPPLSSPYWTTPPPPPLPPPPMAAGRHPLRNPGWIKTGWVSAAHTTAQHNSPGRATIQCHNNRLQPYRIISEHLQGDDFHFFSDPTWKR